MYCRCKNSSVVSSCKCHGRWPSRAVRLPCAHWYSLALPKRNFTLHLPIQGEDMVFLGLCEYREKGKRFRVLCSHTHNTYQIEKALDLSPAGVTHLKITFVLIVFFANALPAIDPDFQMATHIFWPEQGSRALNLLVLQKYFSTQDATAHSGKLWKFLIFKKKKC